MKRPNILWICTDQQRWDTLGCHGNPYVRTPNLDRFAREGTDFTSAYCQSPVCTPSRASFLTGRYPRTTRCRDNGHSLPSDEILVTRRLAEAGYVGGLSGKLHLAPCHPSVCPETELRVNDGYETFAWSHAPDHASRGNQYLKWLTSQGHAFERTPFERNRFVQTTMPGALHQTRWCAQHAIDFFLKNAEASWFFCANIYAPHHPFDPPREYLERYLPILDDIPLPRFTPGELENKPEMQRIDSQGAYAMKGMYPFWEMSDRDHRLIRAAYWAMCDQIDHEVGRMLEALEKSGQRENTIVIFMSDHGEMLGDHGIYLKGPHFYEEAIHVPLLISGPGIESGGVRSDFVELLDLAPTLLRVCDLPPEPGMQGRIISGNETVSQSREDVYCDISTIHDGRQTYSTMLRTERHKIVRHHKREPGELYELTTPNLETRNLWDQPEYQTLKSDLLSRLADRMSASTDPLTTKQAVW